ncbi:MAG: transposase [Desulfuromonadales bacterium]|nr:transposase [Desulfuromonadales bacterium]
MAFNPEIHHRRSIRLRDFDYATAGAYFITVCAHERQCTFGDIVDGVVGLNEMGGMVRDCWTAVPGHFGQCALDEFVVMPNHFHGIIQIVGARFIAPACAGAMTDKTKGAMNRAPTVGEIVRAFKARCTHTINHHRQTPGAPVWQRNYYERIIRNDRELAETRQYIAANPAQWHNDENRPETTP